VVQYVVVELMGSIVSTNVHSVQGQMCLVTRLRVYVQMVCITDPINSEFYQAHNA